jgi:hypothetical protein
MQRVIVCAAIKCSETGKILCGVRHGDDSMLGLPDAVYHHYDFEEQGFVDNKGVFLTRTEAWKVAEAAGQIKRRVGSDTLNGGTLFSENLY